MKGENKGPRSVDLGILQIFKTRTQPSGSGLPLIFCVRLKKGAEPVYMNYHVLKEKNNQLLLDFMERRAVIQDLFTPESTSSFHQPTLSKRYSPPQSVVQPPPKQPKQKELTHIIREAPSLPLPDTRPIRSCRYRNEFVKQRDKPQPTPIVKVEQQQNIEENSEPQSESSKEAERKQLASKKILDYDDMIQGLGFLNLISPAVIPSNKQKTEPPSSTYQLPIRINFKEIQREQYSSEEFKESEQSQFVLDERGKQKRRREKIQREQERLMRKKKVKRIKKKKKTR